MKRLIALWRSARRSRRCSPYRPAPSTRRAALRQHRLRRRRLHVLHQLAAVTGVPVRPRFAELRRRHLHARHLRLVGRDASRDRDGQRRQRRDEPLLQRNVHRRSRRPASAWSAPPRSGGTSPTGRPDRAALISRRTARRRRLPVRIRRASGPRHGACRPARPRRSARGRPLRARATRPPTADSHLAEELRGFLGLSGRIGKLALLQADTRGGSQRVCDRDRVADRARELQRLRALLESLLVVLLECELLRQVRVAVARPVP